MMNRSFIQLIFAMIMIASCQSENSGNSSSINIIPAFPNLKFTRPVDLQSVPDGSNQLFVLEQPGRIYFFENDTDVKNKILFLDITDRVNDRGNEEGLLGFAFHPDFKKNGFFFLNYTADNPRRTVISRFQTDTDSPYQVIKESEIIILEVPQPYSNHNGGQISFGLDGYLYIALGDGGSAGDPQNHAQNPKTLLGSILRIDINGTDHDKNYQIPADNPFKSNREGLREEIYAYGLRNPWRFSFDAPTNQLWTGDVGQNAYEEINIIVNGGNYGWNIREGFHPFRQTASGDQLILKEPIWEYTHQEGQSVTGGFVYRGKKLPELQGHYIYADYVSGKIWALRFQQGSPTRNQLLCDTDLNISSFGIDGQNELYLCAFDGNIYTLQSIKP